MLLEKILEEYNDHGLDRLAVDKVDEVANLRLPRTVLIQEICSALSSLSYVGAALASARPPTYAIVTLLIDAPEHSRSAEEFKTEVIAETEKLSELAAAGIALSTEKDYTLFLSILRAAWENDGVVDRSEALLLAALRRELGIWTREHFLLEHHPDVRRLWENEHSFESARNHLLKTGLMLTHEGNYVLADEVCAQIRRAWDIELENNAYKRLLTRCKNSQLYDVLEKFHLPVSGSKEDRIKRLIDGFIPPSETLGVLHTDELKDLSRSLSLPVSLPKAELVENVVTYFEQDLDLVVKTDEVIVEAPPEPEERILEKNTFDTLLQSLNLDQLSDILSKCKLARSGSKSTRIARIVESPWSETTLLGHLRRSDLSGLCRRLGIAVSGVKEELIERLIEWAARWRYMPDNIPMDSRSEKLGIEANDMSVLIETPVAEVIEPDINVTPPAGYHDIQVDFPDLNEDQWIIMAILRDARSLTEREIERAAKRHQLGWSLIKAEMADLLAHLKHQGRSPIRIRSTGGVNIYEWAGKEELEERQINRDAARDVIDALRQGVVPERHLDLLAIGQDTARAHLTELLTYVEDGKSAFKFIRGSYGAGKTFLTSWLREKAFEKEFAVATVRIGPDQPLSDLPVFFSGMMNGLRTPEKRDAFALADILESWLLAVHKKAERIEGATALDLKARSKVAPLVQQCIDDELARLNELAPGFAQAVGTFYAARIDGDHERANTALSWIRGSRSLSPQALHSIGVRGELSGDQVFPRMRAILETIVGGHLRGLLLVVDELELVRRFPHARQREQAYETLRLLVDETGENGLPGCLLLFTGTDSLFDDARYGLASYEALSNRINTPPGTEGKVSIRQPVIQLEGLDRNRILSMIERVRDIHATAYNWRPSKQVPDDQLTQIVDHWTSFGDEQIERLPRPILRELVNLLDLCEENPSVSPEEYLRGPLVPDGGVAALTAILQS